MLNGLITNEEFEECISAGLCEDHLKELDEDTIKNENSSELQRKAFLFIRLRILDPLVFGKAFMFEKMETLVSKSNYFSININSVIPEETAEMIDRVLLLDAIVVFTLTQFCKLCCSGCLFQSNKKIIPNLSPETEFIQKLLNSKNVSESDIRRFNPILQENFKGHNQGLIKYCYVIVLLFVRNTTIKVRLKNALAQLSAELSDYSRESALWLEIAEESLSRKEYIESLEAYGSALKYKPYSSLGLCCRSFVFYNLGKYDSAYCDAYISAMVNPYYWKSYYVMAFCLFSQNKFAECIKLIRIGAQKCKKNGSNGYNRLMKLVHYIGKKISPHLSKTENNRSDSEKLNGVHRNSFEDVPDLEASESESEQDELPSLSEAFESEKSIMDVPELSEASNSGDSDYKDLKIKSDDIKPELSKEKSKENCIKKVPKTRSRSTSKCSNDSKESETSLKTAFKQGRKKCEVGKSNENLQPNSRTGSPAEVQISKEELYNMLKEGTQMLLDGCGHLAVQSFSYVLEVIQSHSESSFFEEWEVVCIKYAYGLSNCFSGSYEDLQKSITSFKDIIENHSKITFPAAYYGIGLAFQRLNKFKDALSYLNRVKDILEKGIHFKVYTWPGLKSVINETRVGQLKDLVEFKIRECESPPPPDAICRYDDCTSQPAIYYSDPDFKGFVTLKCSDVCILQYHAQCWKTMKNSLRLTDKEFLEKECLTPDCHGIFLRVEIVNKEGNVDKRFNMLPEKKAMKQKKSKSTKKSDFKEEKKRKRHASHDSNEEKTIEEGENLQTGETNDKVPKETSPSDCDANNCDTNICDKDKSENHPISFNEQPFTIIKKEKLIPKAASKNTSKVKELKKSKPKTISLDEFCGAADTKSAFPNKAALLPRKNRCLFQNERPTFNEKAFLVPVQNTNAIFSYRSESCVNQNEQYDLEQELDASDIKAIECNLYLYLEDFLIRNGPLRVTDFRLVRELENFPTEANIVIAKYGGITEFLKGDTNYRFGIVDDLYICSREDLVDAYKLSRSSGVMGADNADLLEEYQHDDFEATKSCNSSCPSLNPDAKEYQPVSSSNSDSINSFVSVPEESSNNAKTDKAIRNSPSLVSAISKLRQPLAVDNDVNKLSKEPLPSFESKMEVPPAEFISDAEVKNSSSCMDSLAEKCISFVKLYSSDEMRSQRSYIDSHIKPFTITCLPSTNHQSLQTEGFIIETDSKSTMKTDDEIEQLKETIKSMSNEMKELEIQKTLMETKLSSEMDCAMRHQKKADVDLELLKKELEDSKLALENQKRDFKNKELKLEREYKLLIETLDQVKEENAKQKSEIIILNSDKHSLQELLEEIRDENNKMKTLFDERKEKVKDDVINMEREKLNLSMQVRKAQLSLLEFKKGTFLARIEAKTKEAAQRMKEIKEYLPLVHELLKKNLECLNISIYEYIKRIAEIGQKLQFEIDKQIKAVNSGVNLETLKPVELKELPEIPSILPQFPVSNVPVGNQPSMFNASMYNLPSSNAGVWGQNPFNVNTSQISSYTSTPQTVPVNQQTSNVITGQKAQVKLQNPKLPPGITEKNISLKSSEPTSLPTSQLELPEVIVGNEKTSSDGAVSSNSVIPKSELGTIPKSIAASNVSVATAEINKGCDKLSLELGYKGKNEENKSASTLSLQSVGSSGKSSKRESSYNKLMRKLKSKYPQYDDAKLMSFISEFRDKRQNGLSGLAVDVIVKEVGALIDAQSISSQPTKVETNAKYQLLQKGLVNKKLATEKKEQPPVPLPKSCPWAASKSDSKNQWAGSRLEEDCIICYEHMTYETAFKVDCGHCFHKTCLKEWLSKKSDCPICRVHVLLPEDYPALS